MGCLKIFLVNGKTTYGDRFADRQTYMQADRHTCRLPKWFLVLHIAARNILDFSYTKSYTTRLRDSVLVDAFLELDTTGPLVKKSRNF